jgi:hypothetical protein
VEGVDGAGLRQLAASQLLPRLRALTMACGSLRPADLAAVPREAFAHLESLELYRNYFLTDDEKAKVSAFHPRANPGEHAVPRSIIDWLHENAGRGVDEDVRNGRYVAVPGGYQVSLGYSVDRDRASQYDRSASWTAVFQLDEQLDVVAGELTETHRGEDY